MVSTMRFDKWQNSAGVSYGTILQVVSDTDSTRRLVTVTANTWTAYPSNVLRVTITPYFNTSKILLIASVTLGSGAGNNAAYRILRNSTPIGVGDTSGNRPSATGITGYLNSADNNHQLRTITSNFLDSPATASAINYDVELMSETTNLLINGSYNYTDATPVYNATTISTLTALEIAQ